MKRNFFVLGLICGTPPGSGIFPNEYKCDLNHVGKCDMAAGLILFMDWGRAKSTLVMAYNMPHCGISS